MTALKPASPWHSTTARIVTDVDSAAEMATTTTTTTLPSSSCNVLHLHPSLWKRSALGALQAVLRRNEQEKFQSEAENEQRAILGNNKTTASSCTANPRHRANNQKEHQSSQNQELHKEKGGMSAAVFTADFLHPIVLLDHATLSAASSSSLQGQPHLHYHLQHSVAPWSTQESADCASRESFFSWINQHPSSLREVDPTTGGLPLHRVLQRFVLHRDVIEHMIEQYPASLQHADNKGRLPLHLICKRGREAGIRLMIQWYPKALQQPDAKGSLPLHCAVRERVSLDTVRQMIQTSGGYDRPDHQGMLPLHWAAGLTGIDALARIRMLTEYYPTGLAQRDFVGLLPLHHAVGKQNRPAIVQELINGFPEAVHGTHWEFKERTILHWAIEQKVRVDILRLLIQHHPYGLLQGDESGSLPLHVALENRESVKVVQLLLELDPTRHKPVVTQNGNCNSTRTSIPAATFTALRQPSWVTPDGKGRLPLHVAASAGTSSEIIRMLLKHYPEALLIEDLQGRLPLHAAVVDSPGIRFSEAAQLQLVYSLLRHDPGPVMRQLVQDSINDDDDCDADNGGSRSGEVAFE